MNTKDERPVEATPTEEGLAYARERARALSGAQVSRRNLLQMSGAVSLGALLAACGGSTSAPTPTANLAALWTLLVTTVVLALLGAASAMSSLMAALSTVLDAPDRRPYPRAKGTALALTPGALGSAVVALGRQYGVECRVNQALTMIIKAMEDLRPTPSPS